MTENTAVPASPVGTPDALVGDEVETALEADVGHDASTTDAPRFIRTLTEDVEASAFEAFLPHEHVICDFSRDITDTNSVLIDEQIAADELARLDPYGEVCVVEVTPRDVRRDPQALLRLSRQVSTRLVMGTGWYMDPYYPTEVRDASVDRLAQMMVDEITVGVEVGDERVRAGVIGEIGAARMNLTDAETRVLEAAGLAALETGAAVTTHAFIYPVGIEQLKVLTDIGVAPERIIIGHADSVASKDYHLELLDAGVYLQFDGCGRSHLVPDEIHLRRLVDLLDGGWSKQILLSRDVCFRSDLRAYGGRGYDWLFSDYLAALLDHGVPQDTVDTLIRHNPARALTLANPTRRSDRRAT